jgi:predicted DsbA family dithiol-disulfide isomerase
VSEPLPIVVYSDVICPWCYVGKRRLQTALDGGQGMPESVHLFWRPFELNPDMPAEGMERQSYRARKFGKARSAELDRNMVEVGREAGITFAFDQMRRTPNTRLAHRLVWEAERQHRQNAVVDRLFQGYFEEGLDIGAPMVLERLAADSGLEAQGVRSALTETDSLDAVTRLEEQGYRMGIQGVPFFILLQKYQVSGAQPPEFWRDALPRLVAEAASTATVSQA